YDSLSWMASIDGSNFHGNLVDGTTSDYPDTWIDTEFDLTDVYTLGNLCGQQDVWVAFIFESDLSITNGGAYLDDIEIRRSVQDVNLPDLTPFQVPGWDDTLVVSNVIGTTTSAAAVYDDQTVYIDYSCLNAGVADANAFSYGLWVDDVHRKYVDISNGLQVNQYSYVLDSNLGVLDAGWHTIEIRCDYDDQVVESDELNNNYSRQVYIHPRNPNGEIHGFKWNDNNENGLWDTEEQALPNWTIYLDLNENCQLDPNESSSVTDADGAYHFTGLDAGTYVVAEIADANCPQIYPAHAVLSTPADSLSSQQQAQIAYQIQDSPPHPPEGSIRPSMSMMSMSMMSMTGTMFQTAYMLSDVPTSTWTYGCSATAAGMIFGYYDRTGYSNMYTGSTNGGICPLTDLGQGIDTPITGACSIIATQNGFDGRSTDGHVDDYWISYDSAGPDPWQSGGTEHTWGECTADYMGTNQWQWDTDLDGSLDSNIDGGTTFYYWTDGSKMYDFIPDTSYGTPQTALCHGLRLFAESRGYTVIENYNQLTDNQNANGFSFDDFQSEIDAGKAIR
ncbi:MAG: SdrD B-like domain-containing protein, partial [Planctomycetota bacterium]